MSEQDNQAQGLVAWFARNSVAANLLMGGLIVAGFLIMGRINYEVLPPLDPRIISVNVAYPGATPEEVEDGITRRVEDAVISLEGVDRVRSSASEGLGNITIELDSFVDAQIVKDETRDAIDRLIDFPPRDAEEPEITALRSISPVLRLVVFGDVGERALKEAAETLERDLRALDDVSAVTLQGARNYEIAIDVSQETLRQYDMGLDRIAAAIRNASLNLSAGAVRSSGGDILLRTQNEARDAQEFAEIIILSDQDGQAVRLGDIATVKDGFIEDPLSNTYDGQPALFLQIDRSADENAFAVRDTIVDFLETYQMPQGVEVVLTADTTEVIRDRVNLLVRNGLLGLSLVFVFLALTLDLRLAFWTCVGIPVAFLGGTIIFGQFVNINMISLMGLLMVLGVVVDDAIVVGENIYEAQTRSGHGVRSAIIGAHGVLAPVLIAVLTSMIAFATLLLSPGVLGQMLRPVPIVVLSVLFISLVEVFFVLPAHLSHGGEWSVGAMRVLKQRVQMGLETFRERVIMPLVGLSVRLPYATLAVYFGTMIAAFGLFRGGHVRFIFSPPVEGDEITMVLEMPEGTPFEQTERTMARIVDAAYTGVETEDTPLIKSLAVTVGGRLASGFSAQGTVFEPEVAVATLELVPPDQRTLGSDEVEKKWRDAIGTLPGIKSLTLQSSGLGAGADVSFNLSHPHPEQLRDISNGLIERLGEVQGVIELETSAELGKRQFEFTLTPAGAAAGLSVDDLARTLRRSYFGEEVQRFQRGQEEISVFVRFPEAERQQLSDLTQMRIPLPQGGEIALARAAQITETRSFASIDRLNGQRIVTISADVDEAVTTPNAVNALIARDILPDMQTQYPRLRIRTEGQARNQARELVALTQNFALAVIAIYVLLASILRSYFQPFIILLIIPFGMVGAAVGHLLLGFDMSFLSLFGVVALSGVIINDSVVLIDYFNILQRRGGDLKTNIIAAVRRRFRPILLTTLTTFIGLVPIISETSIQAQFLIPMALSLAYGILFASFVILLIVPACLMIASHIRALSRVFRRAENLAR